MASKSMKPSAPVRREPTQEEKQEQALRALLQERKMLVQGIAFNLAGNPAIAKDGAVNPQMFAEFAISATDAIMERLYGKAEQGEKTEK